MAHIKTGAATKGNRDSIGKRLGIKVYGGSSVVSGNILVRQRGAKFKAGDGTRYGRDYTIYAICDGTVQFKRRYGRTFVVVQH
ncbi:50S ribosomal protein L27 [Candidatus Gottesmanbacteria bacterium]|nr:50S ribosomal protein L27 [Candidatus Gottesmanbacteria bacterium]